MVKELLGRSERMLIKLLRDVKADFLRSSPALEMHCGFFIHSIKMRGTGGGIEKKTLHDCSRNTIYIIVKTPSVQQ